MSSPIRQPIPQSRPFEQRLADFGPELGAFLARVWRRRNRINRRSFRRGMAQIYRLYSGVHPDRDYQEGELFSFIRGLRAAARGYLIKPQGFNNPLSDFGDDLIRIYGEDLWTDFFHVLSSPSPARAIRSRVYVHASCAGASVELMRVIVGQFGRNAGLWEAKTAGPGSLRLDTICCYLYDAASANALVGTLQRAAPGRVADPLPPLVRRVAAGIGVADEPPAIEIYRRGGDRHSFGSFFSSLCWIALKTTPRIGTADADGRHMLDNMQYSLRTLKVDPRNPQRFPEAAALEAWYRAAMG